MGLQDELNQLTTAIENETSPENLQVISRFIEELKRKYYAIHSLQAGDMVDDFTLCDASNRPVRLYKILENGPVVLSFYRGGWCPYCNLALKALHYALADIEILNAQLLAVSPEKPENMQHTIRKNRLDFTVLSDANSEIARRFGIAVTLPDYMAAFYRSFGLNLSRYNADVVARLPLPATYVIDTHYTIQYVFVDEDHTRRADPQAIIKALQVLENASLVSYG